MDAGNDHSCNSEGEGGLVHSASDSRQMEADVVEQRYRRLVDHSPDAIAVHEGGRVVDINPAAEQHFQTVVNSLHYGVAVVGSDGRVESANPAVDRIFGTRPEVLKNRPANRSLEHPIYDTNGHLVGADRHPLTQIRQTGTPISDYVFGVDRSDGQRVWLCASYCLLSPHDPQHSAVLVSLTDITAQRTASERLAYEATHDSLTGLPNRAHVVTRVTEALESGGHHVLAAVLFIDLDNLKTINDSLGHDAGDDLLRSAAQRLRRAVRSDDVVGRLGGDEFVALLIGQIARPDLDALADRLHATLSEPVVIEGVTFRIGASIGIVVIENNDPRAAAQLLRDADTAMYAAKTTGRGKSHYFTEQLRDRKRRHPTN